MKKAYQSLLITAILIVLLMIIMTTIILTYLYKERLFYFWDYSLYHDLVKAKAIEFRASPVKAIATTWISTGKSYSDIFTLLIVPFILTFGDSRLVYILSIALVYLLPFSLVMGAIAAKLIPSYSRTVYWSTALLTLLTPMVWAPTLLGYPDVGSALLISLAILVYLQDLQLKHRWQIALIGFLISVAILFRRHYIYDGIAFFASIALQSLIVYAAQMRQRSPEALHNLLENSVRIGWMAATSLITLAVLGLPFIVRVFITNFHLLYASYEVPISEGFRFYGSSYGWLAWMLAALGFAAGIRSRVLIRPVASFIVLFCSLLLMQWVLVVKQVGTHYTLHFTLLVVLGLIAFGWTAWIRLNGRVRILVLSASVAYVIFNASIGLVSVDIPNFTLIKPPRISKTQIIAVVDNKANQLFSANYLPLKRADYVNYDEVTRLIAYLRNVTSSKEPIYVAASSVLLNQSLVSQAEQKLYPRKEKLNILGSPDIDSRDFYPLTMLLQAQYVVVATPWQYHLKQPEEQHVVKVVVDAFTQNWELAQDFTRLPVQFLLADGAVVNIYKRIHTTSFETALDTLKAMQNYIGRRPGNQCDWIGFSEAPDYSIIKQKLDIKCEIKINPVALPEVAARSFLYLERLPDQVRVEGKINYQNAYCTGTSLDLNTINAQGEIIKAIKFVHHPSDIPKFALSIQTKGADYLLFKVSVNDEVKKPVNQCLLSISALALSAE